MKTNVSILALHMWRAELQDGLGSARGTRRGGVTLQLYMYLQSCVRVEIFHKKCIQKSHKVALQCDKQLPDQD